MMGAPALQISTPSDTEIVMTREFDAPRHLVYRAHTEPELLKRWLGVFNDHVFVVCDMDLRVGGKYRWVWRLKNGSEMGMGGVYREIVPDTRIVATEKFDDAWYEGEALDTTEFIGSKGRTTVKMAIRYQSKAVRDAVLKSPMDSGVSASFDQLAEILKAMV